MTLTELTKIAAAAAAQTQKPKNEVLGYADGKVTGMKPSENGTGTNLEVEFPEPVGKVNVYVKAERVLPEIGSTASFVAVKDEGSLTPQIRLAGRLTTAAVNEVFTMPSK